jgi:single-strand DNA-binding protein
MKNIRNQVQVIGHLGANPEVKMLESGNKLAKFAVAINETYTNKKGEKVTQTQWHKVVAWGALANIVEKLLQKGTHVTIDGKLSTVNYTDKDGIKRSKCEIIASEVLVINQVKAA